MAKFRILGLLCLTIPLGVQSQAKDEMSTYRQILARQVAIRQDLYHLLAMYSGDFDQHPTDEARNAALKAKGVTIQQDTSAVVTRAEVAKALLEFFNFEKGLLYSLTKLEFYALRDIQHLGIMEAKYTPTMRLSGRQLIGVFNEAIEKLEEKNSYPNINN